MEVTPVSSSPSHGGDSVDGFSEATQWNKKGGQLTREDLEREVSTLRNLLSQEEMVHEILEHVHSQCQWFSHHHTSIFSSQGEGASGRTGNGGGRDHPPRGTDKPTPVCVEEGTRRIELKTFGIQSRPWKSGAFNALY
ncbi:hypothetical protein MLD38_009587 [Melastoma candidum]|uniref:Uncharacterized protein n=1 Tax=Melastoma candidum TaxID=119954 RepID=A0ACB9RXQ0_9MYRT|nr:hypothetical protein MLD38_009587 [Melastoma candidum]